LERNETREQNGVPLPPQHRTKQANVRYSYHREVEERRKQEYSGTDTPLSRLFSIITQ
jgi:hypothetical protein